jgi:kinesin family protein 5
MAFTFDHIFNCNTSQKEVFEVVGKPVINSIFEGFNGTIFAYGQTNSGKTFTMQGPSLQDNSLRGITPRIVSSIFKHIENAEESTEFMVKVSILEIYMENLRDLLDANVVKKLNIKTDKNRGTFVDGLVECYVSSGEEFLNLITVGASNRKIERTNMNEVSSRSHLIINIQVKQNNTKQNICKTGKLYLVDLAGSERVSRTGARGQVLEESKLINKSLSALGNVINALFEKQSHVPYRDSRLTRVLQESVGGNNLTSLVITCSAAGINESDTISTLRFGNRAKAVQNQPKINQEITVEQYKLILGKLEEKFFNVQGYAEQLEKVLRVNKVPDRDWTVTMGNGEPLAIEDETLDQIDDRAAAELVPAGDGPKDIRNLEIIAELEDSQYKLQMENEALSKKLKLLESKLASSESEHRTLLEKHTS